MKEESQETVENIVRTTEVVASAALFGAIQGAWYDPTSPTDKPGAHIGPVPIEVAAGSALLIASLLGVGGKYSSHLSSFADGAFAAYISNVARGWGYQYQKERAKSPAKTSGATLREELEALVNA
jgi:hypothetical protein